MAKWNKYTFEGNNKVGRGSPTDTGNVPLVPSQSALLSRSGSIQGLVPVVDANNHPLFPCKCYVAKKLIKSRKATPFYKKGFFAIRLNKIVSTPIKHRIAIAIDPGIKRTGITVATECTIILNIQCNTPDWVKEKVEKRRHYRRFRRERLLPYRKCRLHRRLGEFAPSIKARWNAHLRIIDQLKRIIPLTDCIIEDIKAISKPNARGWNRNFSPLEIGKRWFEEQIKSRDLIYHKYCGYETKQQRDFRGFKKVSNKLADVWGAHCVDSHCLIELLYGNLTPLKHMYLLTFLQFNRRELHKNYKRGGFKPKNGSTRSLGLNRGSLVIHTKYGLTYIGGTRKNTLLSLHSLFGVRVYQYARKEDCKILTKQSWRILTSTQKEKLCRTSSC